MTERIAVVVTSIAQSTEALVSLSQGCAENGCDLFVIGDAKSPPRFDVDGARFFSLDDQARTGLRLAALAPTGNYARKNIGYLLAARVGADIVVETDDDNFPEADFWRKRSRRQRARHIATDGWLNVYRLFTDRLVWPRGLPLVAIHGDVPSLDEAPAQWVDSPIQQGLADGDPDVDAIFRLCLMHEPITFVKDRQVALMPGTWCPFNSQNTTWWRDAFPLLYLPFHCPMRMTDIWRSLVVQRIAWTNGWRILFSSPDVFQERNEHDLMRDFADEIPGYLHMLAIGEALEALPLKEGRGAIPENMQMCYRAFIERGLMPMAELELLSAWLEDIADI